MKVYTPFVLSCGITITEKPLSYSDPAKALVAIKDLALEHLTQSDAQDIMTIDDIDECIDAINSLTLNGRGIEVQCLVSDININLSLTTQHLVTQHLIRMSSDPKAFGHIGGLLSNMSDTEFMETAVCIAARIEDEHDEALPWDNPFLVHDSVISFFSKDIKTGESVVVGSIYADSVNGLSKAAEAFIHSLATYIDADGDMDEHVFSLDDVFSDAITTAEAFNAQHGTKLTDKDVFTLQQMRRIQVSSGYSYIRLVK